MKPLGITRKVYGRKARFCDTGCADSFKCDRKHGLIYGSWRDDDGTTLAWEEGSLKFETCAYCRADLTRYPETAQADSTMPVGAA